MKFDFSGKTVLVTGASGGIGYAIAYLFAESGARVVFHYNRNQSVAEKMFANLPGKEHFLCKLDLSQPDQIHSEIQGLFDQISGLSILVNNAGIFQQHIVNESNFVDWHDAWAKTLSVNLLGPANLIYSILPSMEAQGGGKIINITSRGAFRGEPNAPAYGASKAGLNSLSQSMAKLLGPKNIQVYAIAPGFTDTERVAPTLESNQSLLDEIPIGRVAKPEEVARTVLFLASPGQESLSGGIIDVNGASYLRS